MSRQGFQNKEKKKKENEYECPLTFFHFSVDQCEKHEWAQRELLTSVLFLWAKSKILDAALWIYLSYSSSPNVKFLSIDMWIKETKHVKIPGPNSGNLL